MVNLAAYTLACTLAVSLGPPAILSAAAPGGSDAPTLRELMRAGYPAPTPKLAAYNMRAGHPAVPIRIPQPGARAVLAQQPPTAPAVHEGAGGDGRELMRPDEPERTALAVKAPMSPDYYAGADAQPVYSEADVQIASFALQLECLEAQFYSYAAYGQPLSAELLGSGATPATGGQKAGLSPTLQAVAEQLAEHEAKHLALIRETLGDGAVACSAVDIGIAFAELAAQASGDVASPPFSPYQDDASFLLAAMVLEDLGVSAYGSAVEQLSDKSMLLGAVSILATESYHGGSVRALLYERAAEPLAPYTTGITVGAAADALLSLLSELAGGESTSPTGASAGKSPALAPVDGEALVDSRSAEQVLAVLYLGDANQPGGFFPQGVGVKW